MARPKLGAKPHSASPPIGDSRVQQPVATGFVPAPESPVALMQEQLAASFGAPERKTWSPRASFWLSVGGAGAMWFAIGYIIRASL
jgi:hypothetical protein